MKDTKIGNLDADQEFQGARTVKRAKLIVLRSDGKGNRLSRATALSEDEENERSTGRREITSRNSRVTSLSPV